MNQNTTKMFSPRRWAGMVCMAVVALGSASCSNNSRPAVHPVRGQVFFENRPAAGARVFFHALTLWPETEARMPQGVVKDDGSFQLTTFAENDGAPAGPYVVSFMWTKPINADSIDEVSILPQQYTSMKYSGIQIEIVEGDNNLKPFQLKK